MFRWWVTTKKVCDQNGIFASLLFIVYKDVNDVMIENQFNVGVWKTEKRILELR